MLVHFIDISYSAIWLYKIKIIIDHNVSIVFVFEKYLKLNIQVVYRYGRWQHCGVPIPDKINIFHVHSISKIKLINNIKIVNVIDKLIVTLFYEKLETDIEGLLFYLICFLYANYILNIYPYIVASYHKRAQRTLKFKFTLV